MPHPICYFEIPADDTQRARQFYGDLFGWQFEKMEGASADCDYWSINTGASQDESTSTSNHTLSYGGLMKRQTPQQQVTQYVSVEALDAMLEKAKLCGATVIMPKTAVPGKGYFALCLDLDHNPFGLWQCDANATA